MQINRNIYFSSFLIDALVSSGIDHFVLSPGSRNTPLTVAVANNKKAISYSLIDERAAGFFATGLSRSVGKPVVLICTSGTAAAEYLPAVIEAYFQEIPLIILTADRPEELRGTGANQTIYQHGLYTYYVRESWDLPPPECTVNFAAAYVRIIRQTLRITEGRVKSPVHINLQFDKPLEPSFTTDKISAERHSKIQALFHSVEKRRKTKSAEIQKISRQIRKKLTGARKIIIIAGPNSAQNREELEAILALSTLLKAPVFADVFSGLRAVKYSDKVISNYDQFVHLFAEEHFSPDLILQIGRVPSSKSIELFYSYTDAPRIIITPNEEFMATIELNSLVFKSNSRNFLTCLRKIKDITRNRDNSYIEELNKLEKKARISKSKIFHRGKFSEPVISHTIAKSITNAEVLFLGNSMPPRDFDFAVSHYTDGLKVYHNRGASGIDGILASAAGAAAKKLPLTIIIGDVSFFYDISSLYILKQLHIPVTIVLLNNKGGKIFDLLPIKNNPELLRKYFHLPPDISFRKIITSFGFIYKKAAGLSSFKRHYNSRGSKPMVIECITKIEDSVLIRKQTRDVFLKRE